MRVPNLVVAVVALAVGVLVGRWSKGPHYQLTQVHGVILRLNTSTGQTCIAAAGNWWDNPESNRLANDLPRCK